jgi:hypothetical protein
MSVSSKTGPTVLIWSVPSPSLRIRGFCSGSRLPPRLGRRFGTPDAFVAGRHEDYLEPVTQLKRGLIWNWPMSSGRPGLLAV